MVAAPVEVHYPARTIRTPGFPTLTYLGSTASRVEKGKLIVLGKLTAGQAQDIERTLDNTGYVRNKLVNLAERFTNTDSNALTHDRAGLLTVVRGGGAFEFGLTPAPNMALDDQRLVIGEVVRGLDVVELLNQANSSPSPHLRG